MNYNFPVSLEFKISESNISIDELIKYVQKKYGPQWKFNRTEARYTSCIMAIFEEI